MAAGALLYASASVASPVGCALHGFAGGAGLARPFCRKAAPALKSPPTLIGAASAAAGCAALLSGWRLVWRNDDARG